MTCPDASKGGRHRWDSGKLISLQAAVASLRKRKYCVAENVKYCICLSLCLERVAPISQSPWLNPAFSSPHFARRDFPDLFGPVADLPILRVFRGRVLLCSLPA